MRSIAPYRKSNKCQCEIAAAMGLDAVCMEHAPRHTREEVIQLNKTAFVYMIAVVEEPTVVGEQGGQAAKVLLEPTFIIAGSRKAAIAKAGSLMEGEVTNRTRIIVHNLKDDADDTGRYGG